MAKSREIKGRMKAIANIRRITKTMQMIATARFQAALKNASDSKVYTQKIAELIGELATACGSDDTLALAHPLLRTASGSGKHLLLALTSNRGLCGGYNGSVLKQAAGYIKEHATSGVDIEVVGKKGVGYFRFTRTPVSAVHEQFADKPGGKDVEQLAEQYMTRFIAGEYDVISVAYMSFATVARQSATIATLLPLQSPVEQTDTSATTTDYEFLPDADQLLDQLLPVTVKTTLCQCFNEAVVSEHIARMVAMKNATDAADKTGKQLARKFNRARQAAITTELSEIISGAAALE